ncbi:DMT family transporter [Pseudorhodobacter turbinis]|uniref:DMT family transporter n=1 Tax=Pseudorhodobacter turbinis TaxID=2500533 RepID=A0A4P8EE54_9RHOB|nr:DMT family transporter [Pseudorhodobacter turbinis]QCO55311.1 DMT family transporter [Pseudorhodobacter turbinis]
MRPPQARVDNPMFGLGGMCVALAIFTATDTSAKWLLLAGLPVLQVVFVRFSVHFLLASLICIPREGMGVFRSHAPRFQAARAALLLGTTAFNFAALKYLPITITTAIFFSSPIMITIMSVLFLGERVGGRRVMAILVGFAGVLVVVQPWGAGFHPAMALSFCGLMCASGYFVLTRRLAGVESNATSQLWASGLAMVVLTPFGLSVWVWPETASAWAVLGLIGVFGASGHAIAVAAHRYADASNLAPMTYIQVIYATAAGYFIFGNLPSWATAIGTAIIIASGIYIWRRERFLMLQRRRVEVPASI